MVKTIIMMMIGLLSTSAAIAERPSMIERYDGSAQIQAVEPESEQPAQVTVEETVVKQVTGDVVEMRPGDSIVITPLEFPSRGMSMDRVENELGRPVEITPSVGEPPITRWTYADRVVFFEYAKVIHAVARR